jgi:MHS family shikimate/dehydroshikimate transporter-like MFS transporter
MNTTGAVGVRRRSIIAVALVSLIGSTIEWYDFFIYGTAAALVFGKLFFPSFDPLVGTLLAFTTFAVGFVARPVGGIIFGNLGDRIGRKRTLAAALILMGVATTLVGLMPGYATIGAAAPIILTILRFCQGLAVGGQWGGAVLIATENAPQNRRGLFGSFAQLGVPVSIIISNGLFLILAATTSKAAFAAWGWRIPFLLSVLLIIVGLYVQLRLEETIAFERVQEAHAEARIPIWDALRTYPKEIALAAGAFVVINGTFYILITYILAYGTTVVKVPESTMLTGVLISAVFGIFAITGFSALSDKIGRRGLYMAGALCLGVWGFPLFWLVNTGSAVLIWIALVVGQVFLSMMYGPQAAFYSELFSARLRYSGASLGYQIGALFGGGLATIIAAALYDATRNAISISIYILVMGLVSFVSVFLLTETYQSNVDEVQPAAASGIGTEGGQ